MAGFSNNAMKMLSHQYLLHSKGNVETPYKLSRQAAKAVASAELKWNTKKYTRDKEQDHFEMMSELLSLPNSLMNAGTPLNQLSACFVFPVEDSLNEIFTSLKNAALIQQGRSGPNFFHLG